MATVRKKLGTWREIMGAAAEMKKARPQLLKSEQRIGRAAVLRSIDLFCGAGGITEGFRQAGYECLYANDCMPEAIATFRENHPEAWADSRNIENINPSEIRTKLGIKKGHLNGAPKGTILELFSANSWRVLPHANILD